MLLLCSLLLTCLGSWAHMKSRLYDLQNMFSVCDEKSVSQLLMVTFNIFDFLDSQTCLTSVRRPSLISYFTSAGYTIQIKNPWKDLHFNESKGRGRRSSPGRVKKFLFSTSSRQALGPTQIPIQWVPGALSPGVKRPVREGDHSPPSSAEFTPPYVFMA
jgi:hypothetical protein